MTSLSKQEYLKRYLLPATGSKDKTKKKSKKDSAKSRSRRKGIKIVDDDLGWDTFAPKENEFDELDSKLLTADEKPVVADVDIRTDEEKKLDSYRRSHMWKKLGSDESVTKNVKRERHDSDSDLEVPRNFTDETVKQEKYFSGEIDSDLDIPPSSKDHASDSDLDISRSNVKLKKRRHDSDSDLEVDRIPASSKLQFSNKNRKHISNISKEAVQDTDFHTSLRRNLNDDKQKSMESGGKGGLTSVDLLRKEMDKLKKKESQIQQLAQQHKDSTTIYRERGIGKKRDIKKENDEEIAKRKKKEEQYDQWGKGMKQTAMKATAIADTIHESNKSFTRYNDDEDLEAMRKAAMRDGDPMASYIAAKKKQKGKSGKRDYQLYKGPAPEPNRYNIMPGYRWDGVNRSNGFEKKYFQNISNNQAFKEEHYKWSVGDM